MCSLFNIFKKKPPVQEDQSSIIAQLKEALAARDNTIKQKDIRITALEDELKPPAPPSEVWPVTGQELLGLLRVIAPSPISIDLADGRYEITTVTEMLRFLNKIKAYDMKYIEDFLDCDDFTRRIRGLLVCPGWSGIVALDCWFESDRGGHSELLTLLVDDREPERPVCLFLIEGQAKDLIELAEEVLLDNGASKVYNINRKVS